MTKEISAFKGKCLILGSGWAERKNELQLQQLGKPRLNENQFYTVDISSDIQPDAMFDITDRAAWNRFPASSMDFIIFEHLPFLDNIQIAFEECQRVLSDNGVVFYRGGCEDDKSILDIFKKSGFEQPVFYIPQDSSSMTPSQIEKWARGNSSLASKSPNLLTPAFLQEHLPEEALEVIQWHIFTDISYPKTNVGGCREFVKLDPSRDYLSEVTMHYHYKPSPPESKMPSSNSQWEISPMQATLIAGSMAILLAVNNYEWDAIALGSVIPILIASYGFKCSSVKKLCSKLGFFSNSAARSQNPLAASDEFSEESAKPTL